MHAFDTLASLLAGGLTFSLKELRNVIIGYTGKVSIVPEEDIEEEE